MRGAAGWGFSDLPRWVSHPTWERVLAGAEGGCPLSPSSLMSLPSVDDNYDRSFMSPHACQESVENIYMCHMARWVLQAAPAGRRCTSGWRSKGVTCQQSPSQLQIPHKCRPLLTDLLPSVERPCCLLGVTNMVAMFCFHPFMPQE